MIKLTLNPGKGELIYSFEKHQILIGRVGVSEIDIALKGDTIQPVHFKIQEEQDGRYSVHNFANDPFATLNGLPFGKRRLKNNDVLKVGEYCLVFEEKAPAHSYREFPSASLKEGVSPVLERTLKKASETDSLFEEPKKTFLKSETRLTKKGYDEDLDLEDVLNVEGLPPIMSHEEIESLFTEWEELPEKELFEAKQEKSKEKEPIKEKTIAKPITILDLPDNSEEGVSEKAQSKNRDDEKKSFFSEPIKSYFGNTYFRIFAAVLIILITLILIIGGSIYNNLSSKQHQDEIEAARSVTDIALALVYAQVNHIHPRMQNWSDPQFLKTSLESVLSPHHPPSAVLDSQGKLNGKYLLRIYTSKDSSRFVLIAQSEPSFIPWVQASDSIAVDSNSMTLRRIKDLRVLNRLLINPDSLSPDGNDELATLINQGEIIPLSELSDKDNSNGYATPEDLHKVCKEGVNLIYNCPRYSQIGEKIMHKAIELAKEPNISDLKRLHDELKVIVKLKEPILYTTKGRLEALNAREALSNLMPKRRFLIAYLDYDEDEKKTVSKLLATDNGTSDELENKLIIDGVGSHKPLEALSKAVAYADKATTRNAPFQSHEIDEEKPLFLKLKELAKERKAALSFMGESLIEIIQSEMKEEMTDFPNIFENLSNQFLEKTLETRDHLLKKLHELYLQDGEMALAEFIAYVDAAGLKGVAQPIKEPLANESGTSIPDGVDDETLNSILNIETAANLNELLAEIEKASLFIKKDNSDNPYHVLAIQNLVRNKVLEKLSFFILSGEGLPKDEFTNEGLSTLRTIFKKAWIFDPEEIDYFLSEYDLHIQENHET